MGVGAPPQRLAVWTERRRRARELIDRHPFAADQLRLYLALLDVQEPAFHEAHGDPPPAAGIPGYVADRVLPRVVEVTAAHGPTTLARAVLDPGRRDGGAARIAAWLRDEAQDPVSRYLARAAAGPVLEALGRAAGLQPADRADGRRCPTCGGRPQLGYFADAGEALVTAPRQLVCARCQHPWTFARMICAGCGEQSGSKLAIYAETERFPHLRVDACESCGGYLLTVDVRADPGAVPIVDELAALPLDLYAREQGKRKLVPNLMGL